MDSNLDQRAETRNAFNTPANPHLKAEFKKLFARCPWHPRERATFHACGGTVICIDGSGGQELVGRCAPEIATLIADVFNMLAE